MEVLRSDFEAKLPIIKKAILEADFIAIDTEFTGNKFHFYCLIDQKRSNHYLYVRPYTTQCSIQYPR